jgi:hypothetical protein
MGVSFMDNRVLWSAVVVVVLACAESPAGGGGDNGQGPPRNVCVIHADNPHKSSTMEKKGQLVLVGKGWFRCTAVPRTLTLSVKVQKKAGAGWNDIASKSETFHNPPANRKSEEVWASAVGCPEGTFRTAAKGAGINDVGDYTESDWSYSQIAPNPC